jgi:peptidoglycan hydrolase-like protein with peptidoglycan-binding domain
MDLKSAAIVFALLLAAAPAAAVAAATAKHPARTATGGPAAARSAAVSHRKDSVHAKRAPRGKRSRTKTAQPSAAENAYAALPEAERRAVAADLLWVGDYHGAGANDFDARVVEAIKAFQKRSGEEETGILTAPERSGLAQAATAAKTAVGWRLIDDPVTGARLGLPKKLAPHSGVSRTGSRWTSEQGQIRIETFRFYEASLPALFDEQKKLPRQRRVLSSVLTAGSFTISGTQGLKDFVVRAEASGRKVRGVTILYDQATAGIMTPVAAAIATTFQGFPDLNAAPPPGLEQGVEYGTAIVVNSHGDLLTLDEVTNGCAAITVPGLGHAVRVAADKTRDLALIRLYGARNLVPAALAGAGSSGRNDDHDDNLTLVGIADPSAQGGGDAVTRAKARLTAQGLEPPPKLGFAGAAALDGHGRFAGMVDLKAAVADTDTTTGQATLVSATAVHTFLQTHGLIAAAGHGVTNQSVVRVICVRP